MCVKVQAEWTCDANDAGVDVMCDVWCVLRYKLSGRVMPTMREWMWCVMCVKVQVEWTCDANDVGVDVMCDVC